MPRRVWFHDGHAYRPENVWKWMRYLAAQALAPTARTKDQFPIGLTAFAPYLGSSDYYIEVLWAGRYGKGWRVELGQGRRFVFKKDLWRA